MEPFEIALWWLSIIVLLKSHNSTLYPELKETLLLWGFKSLFCSLSLTLSVSFPSAWILDDHYSIYMLLFDVFIYVLILYKSCNSIFLLLYKFLNKPQMNELIPK